MGGWEDGRMGHGEDGHGHGHGHGHRHDDALRGKKKAAPCTLTKIRWILERLRIPSRLVSLFAEENGRRCDGLGWIGMDWDRMCYIHMMQML